VQNFTGRKRNYCVDIIAPWSLLMFIVHFIVHSFTLFIVHFSRKNSNELGKGKPEVENKN
jgi:hypothetical protein